MMLKFEVEVLFNKQKKKKKTQANRYFLRKLFNQCLGCSLDTLDTQSIPPRFYHHLEKFRALVEPLKKLN